MPAKAPTIRPWHDRQELTEVRDLLFSDAASHDEAAQQKRLGINIIRVWQRRGHTPHAVLSTARLIEALLLREQAEAAQEPPSLLSDTAFLMSGVFEAAVARFVTGFCDTGMGPVKRSMYEVAEELGMPREWVEMRHGITHGEVPSLEDMVAVAGEAVEWLFERYWKPLTEDALVVTGSITSDKVRELLRAVLKERKDELRGGKDGKVAELLIHIAAGLRTAKDLTVVTEVLLEARLLLPSSKAQDLNMKVAFAIWDGPLLYLADQAPDFYIQLLNGLRARLAARSVVIPGLDTEKEAVLEWTLHLLFDKKWMAATLATKSTGSSRHALLVDTIEFCLINPCSWTTRLGKLVLEKGDASIRYEWSGYFSEDERTTNDDQEEDVKMLDTLHHTKTSKQGKPRGWNIYDGVWTPRPIGIL